MVLSPLSSTWCDGVDQRGLTYDLVVEFEKALKARLGASAPHLTLVMLLTNRMRLLPIVAERIAVIADGA
jgi:hypothetical protein